MAPFDFKRGTLVIKDGNSHSITVKFGDGNFSWSEKRPVEYILNRGKVAGATIREGDEAPVEVKFDFVWEGISAGDTSSEASIHDALLGQGAWSGYTSTGVACTPFAVDLEFTNDETVNCATGDKETITFADFRVESFDYDARAGRVSVTGKCQITQPTAVIT